MQLEVFPILLTSISKQLEVKGNNRMCFLVAELFVLVVDPGCVHKMTLSVPNSTGLVVLARAGSRLLNDNMAIDMMKSYNIIRLNPGIELCMVVTKTRVP